MLLSHNKHFEECKVLEKWWHNTTTEWAQNNRNITVVCPHPGVVLNDPILSDTKGRLNEMHTITIDLKQSTAENQQKKKEKRTQRILIAEPNSDIQYIYSLFAKQYGVSISDMNIVANGNKCIEILLSNTVEKKEEEDNNNKNNNNDYDIIILDTHLPDISAFEVARKIRERLPHKKIILTTTHSLDNISSMIDSLGIKSQMCFLRLLSFPNYFLF
jgi:CheY-like chemotaxis protein